MKASLHFNLVEEKEDFELACKAGDMHAALHEFANTTLRDRLKYRSDSFTDEQLAVLREVKDEFYKILEGYGICL